MTTLNEVFEGLRILAETTLPMLALTSAACPWGPALVLNYVDPGRADRSQSSCSPYKPVARLWATFANSNKVGKYLRVNVSTLPMEGVRVRAFELRLGTERSVNGCCR